MSNSRWARALRLAAAQGLGAAAVFLPVYGVWLVLTQFGSFEDWYWEIAAIAGAIVSGLVLAGAIMGTLMAGQGSSSQPLKRSLLVGAGSVVLGQLGIGVVLAVELWELPGYFTNWMSSEPPVSWLGAALLLGLGVLISVRLILDRREARAHSEQNSSAA